MIYVFMFAICMFLIFRLNSKNPRFKKFNTENAGIVLFMAAMYILDGFISYIHADHSPKARPAAIALSIPVIAYGTFYRANIFRLFGVFYAYEGELRGWKFTTTVGCLPLICLLLKWGFPLLGITLFVVAFWYVCFYSTSIIDSKQEGKSYFAVKFFSIFGSLIASLFIILKS